MPELHDSNAVLQRKGLFERKGKMFTDTREAKKYTTREGVLKSQGYWGSRSINEIFYIRTKVERLMRKQVEDRFRYFVFRW